MPEHHVDSTAHPRGEAALWAELQAAKKAMREFVARMHLHHQLWGMLLLPEINEWPEYQRLKEEASKP
jgi:hypothetical protein